MKQKKIEKLESKGITLIALVITIIVLLILAGVSIAMLTGENGILSQAQEAKKATERASIIEQVRLDILEKQTVNGSGDITAGELEEILKKYFSNEEENLKDIIAGTTTDGEETKLISKEDETIKIDLSEIYNGDISDGGTTPPEEPEPPSKDENGFFEENSTINGEEGTAMNPTIPEGFKPVDENEAEWGDGTNPPLEEDVNEGLVIEDKQGNQFVWVPVTGNYERNTSYELADASTKAYTDTGYLPEGIQPETDDATNNENAEREAVLAKGGFYISRCEVGKEGESTLVSKKGATVWDEILQEDCKKTAKTFINNDNVKSALCSGIQWDMTMAFVNGKQDGTGNTYDVTTYSSARHTYSIAKSGQNEADRVCNIYDLEGNCWEYVAEKSTSVMNSRNVNRGGFSGTNGNCPASYRINGSTDDLLNLISVSFRLVLYVK